MLCEFTSLLPPLAPLTIDHKVIFLNRRIIQILNLGSNVMRAMPEGQKRPHLNVTVEWRVVAAGSGRLGSAGCKPKLCAWEECATEAGPNLGGRTSWGHAEVGQTVCAHMRKEVMQRWDVPMRKEVMQRWGRLWAYTHAKTGIWPPLGWTMKKGPWGVRH